jgi:hypothetical protein
MRFVFRGEFPTEIAPRIGQAIGNGVPLARSSGSARRGFLFVSVSSAAYRLAHHERMLLKVPHALWERQNLVNRLTT